MTNDEYRERINLLIPDAVRRARLLVPDAKARLREYTRAFHRTMDKLSEEAGLRRIRPGKWD